MRDISLVATDMDGTLLDGAGRVPAGFDEWVLAHPDIQVVIASGRQVFTLQEQFASIEDRLIFIADNGAVVMQGNELLFENSMDADDVREVVGLAAEHTEATIVLCGLKSAYIAKSAQDVSRRNIEQYYARRSYLDDPLEALAYDKIAKIALFFEGGTAAESLAAFKDIPAGLSSVVSSVCWIDIADETVNKGAAIQRIQERLRIAPSVSMAFGDYLNDIKLLMACDESYAMANAVPEVKAIARHLAPANTENGVMSILRRLSKF